MVIDSILINMPYLQIESQIRILQQKHVLPHKKNVLLQLDFCDKSWHILVHKHISKTHFGSNRKTDTIFGFSVPVYLQSAILKKKI